MGAAHAITVTACICIIHYGTAESLIGPVWREQKALDKRDQQEKLS